ncbi:MAG: hypothetical protein L6R48_03095, partial [Planctomycetes bacterium]|nr:hypothetical protein [Planctomycetota bacterium]
MRALLAALLAPLLAAAEPEALGGGTALGLGPSHDAAVEGALLVAVGDGALTTADLADPRAPRRRGRLAGLGAARQVVLQDGIAYVAAREDGLAIVDVRDAAAPRLLARYDTLEKATGLALGGGVCFVACRFHGVELIDVREPARPRHLATALARREVQSVAYADGHLYGGMWGDRQVVVADVRDPRRPREVGSAALDGYGDGVAVRDGVLYAATGHHARAYAGEHWQQERAGEPGWGGGHGLELWDVRDPAAPRLLARHKTRAFYAGTPDMWSVEVHHGLAFLTDTFNGVEVVDVAEPARPRTVARVAAGADDPAGGLAVGPGALYVAGLRGDLRVVPTALARPQPAAAPAALAIAPEGPAEPALDGAWWVVRPGGQVREA